ncbi:MAG: hypothetical protein CM15mP102_12090 [Flavobacteriales bacterium]|nr:MAG: hypothetical protein CM15mP102_12090 [Flavobacteriales bacterium]
MMIQVLIIKIWESSFYIHFNFKKMNNDSITKFENGYLNLFGSLPNKDVIRGYDVTKDILLRVLIDKNLNRTTKYDEQSYIESKFLYKKILWVVYTIPLCLFLGIESMILKRLLNNNLLNTLIFCKFESGNITLSG